MRLTVLVCHVECVCVVLIKNSQFEFVHTSGELLE